MKKQWISIAILAIALASCSGKTETTGDASSDSQQPVKKETLQIDPKLSGNEKVAAYFNNLNQVIDEYVTMIEKLAKNGKEKEGKENTAMDAFNMVADMGSSLEKMEPLLEKMDQLEKDGEVLKKDLSPEELQLFVDTYTKMLLRFQEASLKINQ
jgi:PBP1b-binding outer membrane lipoprotein LpoB